MCQLIKGSCFGASCTKSAPYLVWCWYIFCQWSYVFYLPYDPMRPLRWDVMHIYGWELLVACHHPEKFGEHRDFDSYEEKCFIKNMNLINTYCHRKIELINGGEKKMPQSQKCTFWEELPKNRENLPKNWKTFFPLMNTFYNFALKRETSWAKKVVKSILETWNATVIVYVWIIYSRIKAIKNMQYKKE